MHPFRAAIRRVLSFPDRDQFFHAVDGVLTRGEGISPMGRADGDNHRHVADFQPAQAMHHRDVTDFPFRSNIVFNLGQLSFSHRTVGFVFQMRRYLIARQIADRADKDDRAAAIGSLNEFMKLGRVDRFVGQADQVQPPLTGGMIATVSPG